MRRFFVYTFFCLLTLTSIYAGSVFGIVTDSSDNSPLPGCTVKLLTSRDSSFVTGTITGDNGAFSLKDITRGKYVLSISYIGYQKQLIPVRITDADPNVHVDDIAMSENSIMLKELVVKGARTEMKVKEDTIEYDADSYKSQPNAVVEDVLKRLPGVEIGSDGTIKSQGKTISKILIDGKEFFSDDPKVASKTIPATMVDKLQVVDRKSELARLTGVDDGEDETVINLTLKKGMSTGWTGTITAGYGTDNRYQGKAIINHFMGDDQLSIIAGSNNINDAPFTSGGDNFKQFGGGDGINSNQHVGINLNVGKEDRLRLSGDVMYSHEKSEALSRIDRQYIFTDSTSYYKSYSQSIDKGHNVRADLRLKWEIDSANMLEFRPKFKYNTNDSEQTLLTSTRAGDREQTLVNNDSTYSTSNGHNIYFSGRLIYRHKFLDHPGRSLSAQLQYIVNKTKEKQYSFNRTIYTDSIDIVEQIINNHTWSNNVIARLTWTEPIGDSSRGNFLEAAYYFDYKWNNNDKDVWDVNRNEDNTLSTEAIKYSILDELSQVWGQQVMYDTALAERILQESETYNTSQSNSFRNKLLTQRLQLGFKRVVKDYNLNAGIRIIPTMRKSDNLSNPENTISTQWLWYAAPYLRFRYKFNKNRTIQVDYKAKVGYPSMSQLQPVVDASNPQRLIKGNPDLKATFYHYLKLRFQSFDPEKQFNIMAMLDACLSQNNIIQRTQYMNNGQQLTTYENANGMFDIMALNMISFPFRNKHFSFVHNSYLSYITSKGYINDTFNTNRQILLALSPGLTYRNDWFEIQLRPTYVLNYTNNTVQNSSYTPIVHTYGGTGNVLFSMPFGVSIASDITFSGTAGYSDGYNTDQWIWNASISYSFLRNKCLTLQAKGYDLLKQRKNIYRTTTANYIQDKEMNHLSRYFLFSVTYKFNTFGGGNEPKSKYSDHHGRDEFKM